MPHVTHASEALGLSPVALLITDICASTSCRGTYCGFQGFHYTDNNYTFRAAPQTELLTSACMLSSKFLCLDPLHALLTYGSKSARSRLFFSLPFQV